MKQRNPIAILLLPFVTFGIYSIYWQISTKGELNEKGANIPTSWLLIVPIVNIWWLWKYSEGVEEVTNGKSTATITFILLFLLGFIGEAIVQTTFNDLGSVATSPVAPIPAPAAPAVEGSDTTPAPPVATPPVV